MKHAASKSFLVPGLSVHRPRSQRNIGNTLIYPVSVFFARHISKLTIRLPIIPLSALVSNTVALKAYLPVDPEMSQLA